MNEKNKRLGNQATKRELRDAHRVKMEAKRIINDYNTKAYATREYILANISKNHEHYGDTPSEHERRKNGEEISS